MEQALSGPAAVVAPKAVLTAAGWTATATGITAAIVLLAAVGGGVWTLSNKIGDIRDQLRTEIQQTQANVSDALKELGQRVAALEGRIAGVDSTVRKETQRLSESQAELDQKIGKLPTNQQVAAMRGEVERKLLLVQVAQLESRIVTYLAPTTRTVVGTLVSIVPAERILVVEDQNGKTRAFRLPDTPTPAPAKGFCGGFEESVNLTNVKPGTPILVAYEPGSGGRHTVRLVAKSSCA